MKLIKLLSESMIDDSTIEKVYNIAIKKYGEEATFNQILDIFKIMFGANSIGEHFYRILAVVSRINNVSEDNVINYFSDSHKINLTDNNSNITCIIPPQNVKDDLYDDSGTLRLETLEVKLLPVGYFNYGGVRIEIEDTINYSEDELIEKYPNIQSWDGYESFSEEIVDYIVKKLSDKFIMKIGVRLDHVMIET
jgi:hypothetical protein